MAAATTTHAHQGGEHDSLLASPLVDDLDNDGLLETVAAGVMNQQAAVHIWQEVGENESRLSWPMFHRNPVRNGRYMPPRLIAPVESRLLHPDNGSQVIQGQIIIENSGDDPFQWKIDNAPKAVHFNEATGTIVDETELPFTVDARAHTKDTWHNLGVVTISGLKDGQHILDSPKNVTVWLYVGDPYYVYIPGLAR